MPFGRLSMRAALWIGYTSVALVPVDGLWAVRVRWNDIDRTTRPTVRQEAKRVRRGQRVLIALYALDVPRKEALTATQAAPDIGDWRDVVNDIMKQRGGRR